MPKQAYITQRFSVHSRKVIAQANDIIAEYDADGFTLTLRQLYYQFVARDLIPNEVRQYKRIGSIINDARLAGFIDWDAIEDRTRSTRTLSTWEDPRDLIESSAQEYRIDKWENQPYRPYVWIEKDALVGVIQRVCWDLQVPYLACRGYTSQSEMWRSAQNFLADIGNKQTPVVLHLGDHDPSGIDMTRDNVDRLEMFTGGVRVDRLALNMNQVRKYKPPPNPAKRDDSRYREYVKKYGRKCWELDALDPKILAGLVRTAVMKLRNEKAWKKAVARESYDRRALRKIVDNL